MQVLTPQMLAVYRKFVEIAGGDDRLVERALRDVCHREKLATLNDVAGSLPSYSQTTNPSRTPLIPTATTIIRGMGVDASFPPKQRWAEAMRRAASILNIYGGRYGLPEKKAS